MSSSSKKTKSSPKSQAQRNLRTQQIFAALIGIVVILSMIIGLVTTY